VESTCLVLKQVYGRSGVPEAGDSAAKGMIQSLIQPYPAEELEAYPVRQLKGKNGVGNSELAKERFEYAELNEEFI
jgi:hypothetical protein